MSSLAMSRLFMSMIASMRIAMPVITAMGLMENLHLFEFMTLARNDSE